MVGLSPLRRRGLQIIAVAANQPPVLVNPATGIPTATINPMHPWVADPPSQATIKDNGDGTWKISAANTYRRLTDRLTRECLFSRGFGRQTRRYSPTRRAGRE